MQHLSDEQLTAHLYGETLPEPFDIAHLEQCPECAERFRQFELASKELNLLSVPQGEPQIDIQKIVAQEADVPTFLQAKNPNWERAGTGNWRTPQLVVAATLLLLVAGLSFLIGIIYQTQTSKNIVQEQVAASILELQAKQNYAKQKKESARPTAADVAELRKSISRIKEWIANRPAESNIWRDQQLLAKIDAHIADIMTEQAALRKDLQTLAINAEDEILLTKKEIMQINEFISTLFDSNTTNFQE